MIVRTSLLILTTGIMLGCSTFSTTKAPEPIAKAPYRGMNCEELHRAFEPVHTRMLDIHLADPDAEQETVVDSSEPVWKNMLNSSIHNVQQLLDYDEDPHAAEIIHLNRQIAVFEEIAVEKSCTQLLASLTEHRVKLRQMTQ